VREAPLIPDRSLATRLLVHGSARYIPALDGIRGLAIVWVVLHNATDISMAPASGVFRALGLLTHTGWIGVQLFFALSGFLITGGLLDTQRSAHYFRDFYAKRALRILPLYYGVLFALLVVVPLIPAFSASISSEGQASLWLFTVNWTHTAPYGFAHFWSLAIEEQFYILWPLVVWRLTPLAIKCMSLVALGPRAALRAGRVRY
jgi:peptidoglycan/LPS O-acetylase OafA/YrhL